MKRSILITAVAASAVLAVAACNRKDEAPPATDTAMDAAATTEGGVMSSGQTGSTGGAMSSGSTSTTSGSADASGGSTQGSSGTMTARPPVSEPRPANTTTREGTAPVGATMRGDSAGTATPLPAGQATTYSRTN